MSAQKYSSLRPSGREHMPIYPKGFIALRIVQLIVAAAILGLCAYTMTITSFDGNQLAIFTSVATLIITIYCLVVEFSKDAWSGYNYWAVMSLDMFALVFWLVTMALVADRVAPLADGLPGFDFDTGEYVLIPLFGTYLVAFSCMATVAGLSGVEFLLFIVSLAIHSVAMHRHRAAGLHCTPVQRDTHGNMHQMQEKRQPTPRYSQIAQTPPSQQAFTATPPPPPPPVQAPYQSPPVHQSYQGYFDPPPHLQGQGHHGMAAGPALPHAGSYHGAQSQAVGHQHPQ